MANFSHVEPIHVYSLWGSHISPSNSKWIQENRKDMDMKVDAMRKHIEENADSYQERVNMYFKKRFELKKLVDEFSQGYHALAERYEHSTRALRHAHGKMVEAFPNQIPSLLSDESPHGLSGSEDKPHTPEMLLPVHTLFASDDLKKDAMGLSSDFHVRKRHGSYSEESDSLSSKRGLKQYNDMLVTGEGAARADSSEGKVRKGVNLLEEEGKNFENKSHNLDQEAKVKQDASNVIKNLQQDISQLSSEIHVLKDQIMEESKRANNAENEIQSLKGALSKLNSEKDAALLQYQVSVERISSLELLLSHTQHDLKNLSDDMVKEVKKIKNAEKLNQSLQLGLDTIEKKAKMQEHEINQKQEELEKLQTILQDKYQQFLEAEVALVSSKKKFIRSQEEAKLLGLEIQKGTEKLRNVEQCNMGLEEEICKLKEENNSLNEQNIHSNLMIKGLQDEIISLKENKRKLEDEIRLLLEEKEVLSQELYRVKEDKNYLGQRYKDLVEKMQAVSICADSLQAAVKYLQNGNYEHKEVCKKHEAEKELLVEKLKDMDKVSEKNVISDRFLSDANDELEVLREKVVALENTHESLKCEISIYITERDSLAFQVKILTENMEMLSANNTLLENSLSAASTEVESLRTKLKNLEEFCQLLDDQNSGLRAENYDLVFQVESVTSNMENLESRYAEVMDKYLNLSRERELMINQVKELGDILKMEKQQQETLSQSYKNLLSTSEKQISLLQEENQHKEKELQAEQHNLIGALIENFILQRSLFDLKESNLVLSVEGHKYLEACRSAQTLVSKLEQEKLIQMRDIMSLTRHTEKISNRIRLLCKALTLDKVFRSVEEIQDDALLDITLNEIKKLLNSISEAESNNQQLQLEISILATLIKHIGIDVVNLGLHKYSLERELEIKNEELFALGHEKHELLGRNDQLTRDMEASNQREQVLEIEIKVLHMQLTDMKEALQTTQYTSAKLIEEKKSLSQEICKLRQQYNILEEEHIEVLLEAKKLDHLYLFFKSLNAERVMELKSLGYNLDSLHVIKNNLASEISRLNEKISVLEAEKMHFSNSVTYLEVELRNRLLILEFDLNTVTSLFEEINLQMEIIKNQLIEKETQLSEANQKIQCTQEKNIELNRLLEALQLDNVETKLVKEEMEKKVSDLSEVVTYKNEEIRCLCEENRMMQTEIDEMHKRVEVLACREEHLISELQKETSEIVQCEGEIAAMLTDIQFLKVNSALQDEKVHELIVEGEIGVMVQKEVLVAELSLSKRNVEELSNKLHELEGENTELKAGLDVYLFMLKSLWDGVATMEEQIMSISKPKLLSNHAKEDMSLMTNQDYNGNQLNENPRGMKAAGVFLLQKLIDKVKSLQNVIIDIISLLENGSLDSNASLKAERKEVEMLKTKAFAGQGALQSGNDSIKLDVYDGKDDAEYSKRKHEQVMEDTQHDRATSSPPVRDVGSHRLSIKNPEIDDQSWESAERSCSNQTLRTSIATENDIQSVDEEKSYYPSKLLMEELSIYKLDLHKRPSESQQEWNKVVLKGLDSDAQRLSDLKNSIEELKERISSEKEMLPASYGYASIKEQLNETGGVMLELIDTNCRLKKMAEGCSSLHGTTIKPEEGSTERRQISEQAKWGSVKVGRLELKLQKIQYVLMKLEKEHESRRDKTTRRNRVALRDYLYGRRDNHRERSNSPFCDCMSNTKADH